MQHVESHVLTFVPPQQVPCVYKQTTREIDNNCNACLCFVIISKKLRVVKTYYYFK